MNKGLFAVFFAIATAGFLAIGCDSSTSYTETETDVWDSDGESASEPTLEIEGYTETDEDPIVKKK